MIKARKIDETLLVSCRKCKDLFRVLVDINDYHNWQKGWTAQKAFPYLDANQRELLISNTCGECFDSMFGTNEEGDSDV